MKAIFLSFVVLTTLVSSLYALSATGSRVLVLLDDLKDQPRYSRFWQSLQERQFQLDFKQANDPELILDYFGKPKYEQVIHFAPKTEEIAVKNPLLIKYVSDVANLLVAVDAQAGNAVRDLASEFDIEFDPKGTHVLDKKAGTHDNTIVTSQVIAPASIISQASKVLYNGIGLLTGDVPLVTRILSSEADCVSAASFSGSDATSKVDLIAAMQTRSSTRATFVGSLDFFSDAFWSGDVKGLNTEGNKNFITELTKWTFAEKSVLKVVDHRHHPKDSTEPLPWYRIKDDIVYTLEVTEFKDGQWVPFHADDIQLEVIMLDPYIRTTLKDVTPASQDHFGRFAANVKLPDVYGVFTFKVNYKRPGWTYLLAEDVVAIRPFRHNEYPRFLSAAYPYYASVGSMIAGFLVFSLVWLSTWGIRAKSQSQKQKSQ
ncbi:Dolichyl-diphosphooligosaccharide-protein glycosyltransferase 48kDa subunit [Hesseltinella vesiculosa]|uniref:Dolichyl-diphosphooligosaccharide--protein glycosyltransferase subunit WBP1 n=1 Tax=Hesseltinella vesiculosa TaxID=101127 RepID=A0A1X2GQ00_9FUNG|nr:Dolichyl-diphosphooligosaccharide-protein glycosyltransferase 48kDa subunit [Hesseltinella vesiculosa]